MTPESRHQCLIYEGSPSQKLAVLAAIIKSKLEDGYRCLYLNSPPMVAGMRSTLAAIGIEIETEIDHKRILFSSETISPGMEFDSTVMVNMLENELNQAVKDGFKGLWASGDMTWEFGPAKDFSKLLEYELKLEELFGRRSELCGVCQYHRDSLPRDAMRKSLLVHPALVISGTLSRINPYYLRAARPADQDLTNELDQMIAELCKLADD